MTTEINKIIGPLMIEAKVYFATKDSMGSATVGLGIGQPVSVEDIYRAIGQTLAALPKNYRLLTPDEFFNRVVVKEKTGRFGNFAVPASFKYDPDELAKTASEAYTPEPATPEPDDGLDDGDTWEDEDEE